MGQILIEKKMAVLLGLPFEIISALKAPIFIISAERALTNFFQRRNEQEDKDSKNLSSQLWPTLVKAGKIYGYIYGAYLFHNFDGWGKLWNKIKESHENGLLYFHEISLVAGLKKEYF